MAQLKTERPKLLESWFRGIFVSPLQPYGDYFERLGTRVESSAPACEPCCS